MEQIDEPEELKNENPIFLMNIFETVTGIFINYGWFLFCILMGIIYIYNRTYPFIEKYFEERNEREYSAKYHKNVDLFNERQMQMQKSRAKMQEKMSQSSIEYKLKMEAKELKRRQELEEKYNNDPNNGHRLGSTKTLKTESFPLMGNSSGSNYRAPKRSACGSKGCGK